MRRHLDLMIEVFGQEHGCCMFRKVAPWHARRFGPANRFNKNVVRIASRAEFDEVLADYVRWREQFLDERGELKPRFQPPPLVASFMQPAGMAAGEITDAEGWTQGAAVGPSIPVPKGPVEVW
jgi:hypothetical protein